MNHSQYQTYDGMFRLDCKPLFQNFTISSSEWNKERHKWFIWHLWCLLTCHHTNFTLKLKWFI